MEKEAGRGEPPSPPNCEQKHMQYNTSSATVARFDEHASKVKVQRKDTDECRSGWNGDGEGGGFCRVMPDEFSGIPPSPTVFVWRICDFYLIAPRDERCVLGINAVSL